MSASDLAARPTATLAPTVARLAALGIAFLVCIALVPVEIDQAFGLPAHPLLLHVPVIFDPLLALASIFFALRAGPRRRYGLLWAAFAVVALAATVLTAGAGEAFMDNRPQVSAVLRDHKEAAETLRLLMFGLTAAILVLVALDWSALRRRVPAAATTALAALVAVLALGAGFFTVRAGHLGAKAAWGHEEGPSQGGFQRPPGEP
jgi:hypothetical protein